LGRAMDKGLIWIELSDGFAAPGCPICNIISQGARRYFSSFLHESVTSPGERFRLIQSGGWCARHTLLLLTVESREWPDHMGYGIIAESLLEVEGRWLNKAREMLLRASKRANAHRWPKVLRRVCGQVDASLRCPVCDSEEEREESFARFFIEALFDVNLGAEMEALYRNSEGLCHRHLVACLRACASPERALGLLDLELPKIEALRFETAEYVRKHEHRYRGEAFGKEIDAWARASRKLASHFPESASLRHLVDVTKRREKRTSEDAAPLEAHTIEKERNGDGNSH